MSQTLIQVGPDDHGRRMTLEDFEHAEGSGQYVYELGRGVIAVIDVPHRRHLAQVDAVRVQIYRYRDQNPGRIAYVAGGSECKLLIEALESERHPDLAIYQTGSIEECDWSSWVPEIVIEVVSPSSERRDYDEKPDEYLQFGVREYWIFDARTEQMTVLRRTRGRFARRLIRPGQLYQTSLLPGLDFDCKAVFDAAAGR